MLRMFDLRCVCCGEVEEHLVRLGERLPDHCGSTMEKIWLKAPGVHYRPHFSHALKKNVERYSDEDKELAKKGQWIATKSEANRVYDTDHFTDNVTVKNATNESIRKHVEKTAKKLVADGRLRVGRNGWESTDSGS